MVTAIHRANDLLMAATLLALQQQLFIPLVICSPLACEAVFATDRAHVLHNCQRLEHGVRWTHGDRSR
jgi:hypothetical protein